MGIVALSVAVILTLVLARSGATGVVARFELVRLARGGRQPLLRGLVALGTLLGLMLAYLRASDADAFDVILGRVELPRDRLAGVGETVLITFLAVEVLAIYLAAPVVAAASVAKEKERKTLDDLLGTGLTAWDVVAGKFLASWLYVLGIAAAGAPTLVAASLFGGVDFGTLIGGAVVVVYGSALLCAAAVRAASRTEGLREALTPLYFAFGCLAVLGTIGVLIPGVAFFSPASTMIALGVTRGVVRPMWVALGLALFTGIYAVYCWWALRSGALALTGEPPLPPPSLPERGAFPRAVPVYGVEAREPVAESGASRVPEEGVFAWKERRGTDGDRAILAGLTVAGTIFGVVFLTAALIDWRKSDWPGDSFNPVSRLGLFAFAVVAPLTAGIRAAGAVARERERGTLDALLATPADRRQILSAKFAGAAQGALGMGLGLLALLVAAAAFGGVYPPGALAGFMAGVGSALLMTTAGLYFSAGARTSLRAVLTVMGCLFFAWVAPIALSPLAPPQMRGFMTALSPPVGAFRAGSVWRFYQTPAGNDSDEQAVLASGWVGVAGTLASGGVWLAARRRFERLGR